LDVRQQFSRHLYTTTARWRTYLDGQLKELGLTRARWSILVELARSDDQLSQRELATLIGVEAPTLVRMLDSLEASGFVERIPDPADRRTKRLRLTERARALSDQISNASSRVREQLLGHVELQDLEVCIKVLDRISSELDQLS
jgi:MarR family transcriptional regulator for hemolysin